MNWKVIKTEREHKKAVKRAMEIFHAPPNTPEDDELGVLLLLIKDYEDRTVKMPEIDVLQVIKEKMKERGLQGGRKGSRSELAQDRKRPCALSWPLRGNR